MLLYQAAVVYASQCKYILPEEPVIPASITSISPLIMLELLANASNRNLHKLCVFFLFLLDEKVFFYKSRFKNTDFNVIHVL